MPKITVDKTAYNELKRQAMAYRKFATHFFEALQVGSIKDIVRDFRKTNLYTEDFLNDLEEGLGRSSYSKRHGFKTIKR